MGLRSRMDFGHWPLMRVLARRGDCLVYHEVTFIVDAPLTRSTGLHSLSDLSYFTLSQSILWTQVDLSHYILFNARLRSFTFLNTTLRIVDIVPCV
jgi:hypothetical protein